MAWCKRRRSGLASLSDGATGMPRALSPMKTGTFRSNRFFSGALMPPQWVGDPMTSKSALRILSARSCPSSCGSEHSPVSRHRMQAVQGAIRQSPIWTSSASGPRVSEATRIIVPIVPFRRGLPLIISDLIRLLFFFAGRTPRASVASSAAACPAAALRFSATTEPSEYSVDRPCRRCSDNDFCYDFLHVVAPVRKGFLSDRRAETITMLRPLCKTG